MTARKVHIRANKAETHAPMALCATRIVGNGTVRYNNRRSYAFMASEIVSIKEAALLPQNEVCAHCSELALSFRNKIRAKNGKTLVNDWREGY